MSQHSVSTLTYKTWLFTHKQPYFRRLYQSCCRLTYQIERRDLHINNILITKLRRVDWDSDQSTSALGLSLDCYKIRV
jgi:hypothetical protein